MCVFWHWIKHVAVWCLSWTVIYDLRFIVFRSVYLSADVLNITKRSTICRYCKCTKGLNPSTDRTVFSIPSRTALEPMEPPIKVPRIFPRRKVSGTSISPLAPSSAQVRNEWRFFKTCTVHFYYFVLWPTKAQLIYKLSHSYVFRHYRVILRELVTVPRQVLIHKLSRCLHVSTLSCHLQTARIHYLAKLHKYFNCSCW